ncbi:MAG: TPM domain-containing protein [Bacilli bacterium]|nr:TPM domain-containing protein [Bacilli bacterium]
MKKLKYLFIAMLLFIGIKNVHAFDNTIKVYDYAQILTEKEETKLKEKINNYIDEYNTDMVIVTVKYYNQTILDEYVNLFYNKNKFGIGYSKDGIIIVIDLKNDKIDIKTYGKATNYYSESEIKNILTTLETKTNYYDKLNVFIDYSNKYIKESSNFFKEDNNIYMFINWPSILIPSIIIPTVIIVIGLLKNKSVKKQDTANYYIKKDSIVINKKEDKFVTTNTKKERIRNK